MHFQQKWWRWQQHSMCYFYKDVMDSVHDNLCMNKTLERWQYKKKSFFYLTHCYSKLIWWVSIQIIDGAPRNSLLMVPYALAASTHCCHVPKDNWPVVALFKVCKHSLLPILEQGNQTECMHHGTNSYYSKLGWCSFQETKALENLLVSTTAQKLRTIASKFDSGNWGRMIV